MLSYLRSQQPFSVAFFILLFGLLKIPFLLMDLPPQAPLAGAWFETGQLPAAHPFLSLLAGQLCLFLLALWFNYLFHKADYHESNTMVPAAYFTLLSALLPECNGFGIYHILLILCFLLIRVFLQLNSLESARRESYNAGAIFGLAVLLMPGLWVFLPFLFLILYALKSFRFHEFVLLFLGVLTPLYLGAGLAYLLDTPLDPSVFWRASFTPLNADADRFDLALLGLTALYLLFSFISLRGILFSVSFRRRKSINMTILLLVGMALTVAAHAGQGPALLVLLWYPAGVFLSLLMLRARKKKVAEILHAAFVLTIFIINILRLAW